MVDLQVTYLEIVEPRNATPRAQRDGIRSMRSGWTRKVTLRSIERWAKRSSGTHASGMAQADLKRLLSAEATLLVILRVGWEAGGLCEFVGVGSSDIELAHFGIVPALYRKGLGSYLLTGALQLCWQHSPSRIWLHTDTNDHPGAVALYEKAGFRRYKQVIEAFPD